MAFFKVPITVEWAQTKLSDETLWSVTTRRVSTLGSRSLEQMLRLCHLRQVLEENMIGVAMVIISLPSLENLLFHRLDF